MTDDATVDSDGYTGDEEPDMDPIKDVLETAQGRLTEIGWEEVSLDVGHEDMPREPAMSFKVPGGWLDLNAVFRPD